MDAGSSPDPTGALSAAEPLGLPRLPVFGWDTFSGPKRSTLPSILDRDDVLFTTSGRAAIALALRALGIGRGDRVLVPTYHCPTMIAPVVAAGAEPVFFPIDASGAPVTDALDASGLRGVRAMIAAHYFGLPQPMAGIRRFCDAHGIALIEDCAHALFGESDGRPVGRWGDYAIASLTKFLPVVDGGCLVSSRDLTRLPALADAPLGPALKSMGNTLELGAMHRRISGLNTLLGSLFSIVARLRGTASAASIGAAVTSRESVVDRWLADFAPDSAIGHAVSPWTRWVARHAHRERVVALRRRNYTLLTALVARVPGVRALRPTLPDGAAPYVFPLWVERPEAVYQTVRRSGIPVFRWDEIWPGTPVVEGDAGHAWATHVFQIGCHQDLRPQDVGAAIDVLARIMTHHAERDGERALPAAQAA